MEIIFNTKIQLTKSAKSLSRLLCASLLKKEKYSNLNMTLDELIAEYKTLPIICSQTNYSDKNSVLANNKAVKRMYEIVSKINNHFKKQGTEEFQKLLNIIDYKTNVWVATQLLEKLTPDEKNEKKALNIIEQIAKGGDTDAIGFKSWLKDFNNKKGSK